MSLQVYKITEQDYTHAVQLIELIKVLDEHEKYFRYRKDDIFRVRTSEFSDCLSNEEFEGIDITRDNFVNSSAILGMFIHHRDRLIGYCNSIINTYKREHKQ